MRIENALKYCVEVYDIANLLYQKKMDNLLLDLINHMRYLTGSDQILLLRLSPSEKKGSYCTFGLNGNKPEVLNQVNDMLVQEPEDFSTKQIEFNGRILTFFYVLYDKNPLGVFAVLSNKSLLFKESFFDKQLPEHTDEMLELKGALPFFLKVAGIVLKKYEFEEKGETYLISMEQEEMDQILDNSSQNLFVIASRLYLLSNSSRNLSEEELEIELSLVKKSIDLIMRELREAICHFTINKREFYTLVKQIHNPDDLEVLVNKFRQLPEDYEPGDLERIDIRYNPMGLLLRHAAREAFETMCRAAEMENLQLKAVSSYRSYDYQNKVYYKNITEDIGLEDYQAIRDRVSARAGHSEHQTGLAVDINDLEQTFENTPAGKWLAENAHRYGFILRYPKGKEHITGYDYEPWHFRYLGNELALSVYQSNITYDEFYSKYIHRPELKAVC